MPHSTFSLSFLFCFLTHRQLVVAGISVWIDTDPSVGLGEVDDGLALLQAFKSNAISIRGISTVYGNAPIRHCYEEAVFLARPFLPEVPIYRGAQSAARNGEVTEAVVGLTTALRRERLVIIALGPLTNIAQALLLDPSISSQVDGLIAVAGRRKDQIFRVGTMNTSFPDLNFEKDFDSFKIVADVLRENNVRFILTPWEISSKVWITKNAIKELSDSFCPSNASAMTASAMSHRDASSACAACTSATSIGYDNRIARCSNTLWVLDRCRVWADLWAREFGTNGFNPFDTLAVGYVLWPKLYECDSVILEFKKNRNASQFSYNHHLIENISIHLSVDDENILNDAGMDWGDTGASSPLLTAIPLDPQVDPPTNVMYCHSVSEKFISTLLTMLGEHY